jgi:hypothetical protein
VRRNCRQPKRPTTFEERQLKKRWVRFSSTGCGLHKRSRRLGVLALPAVGIVLDSPLHAELSPEELTKLAQDPIGDLVHPDYRANWQLRAQIQVMFQK